MSIAHRRSRPLRLLRRPRPPQHPLRLRLSLHRRPRLRPTSRSTSATGPKAASSASCIATASTGKRSLVATTFLHRPKNVDGRDKPGHDARVLDLIGAYCETVCTTLVIGRALEVGTFSSFSSASSYSGSVWKVVFALICTTL